MASGIGGTDEDMHEDIAKLLKNNRKWVQDSQNADPDFFKKIGGPQRPQYLYVPPLLPSKLFSFPC